MLATWHLISPPRVLLPDAFPSTVGLAHCAVCEEAIERIVLTRYLYNATRTFKQPSVLDHYSFSRKALRAAQDATELTRARHQLPGQPTIRPANVSQASSACCSAPPSRHGRSSARAARSASAATARTGSTALRPRSRRARPAAAARCRADASDGAERHGANIPRKRALAPAPCEHPAP